MARLRTGNLCIRAAEAAVPGIDTENFATIANGAKEDYPLSHLIKAADMLLDTRLVS